MTFTAPIFCLRIVIVSSNWSYNGISFDDLTMENDYTAYKAYTHSKFANVLHCKELAKQMEGTVISIYSLYPGTIYTELLIDLLVEKNFPL